jgi:hypothetical protein
MGKVVNYLGEVERKLNIWMVRPYLVEHVGKVIVGRCGWSDGAKLAVTDKIAAEPEVAVFGGQRSG